MTTNDTHAAAERYAKHLAAEASDKPFTSPYWRILTRDRYFDDIARKRDLELLARAYVEERKEQHL